jgi:hypothetical protein
MRFPKKNAREIILLQELPIRQAMSQPPLPLNMCGKFHNAVVIYGGGIQPADRPEVLSMRSTFGANLSNQIPSSRNRKILWPKFPTLHQSDTILDGPTGLRLTSPNSDN